MLVRLIGPSLESQPASVAMWDHGGVAIVGRCRLRRGGP